MSRKWFIISQYLLCCILILVLLISPSGAPGAKAWSGDPTENTAICTAADDQGRPVIASDGSGGAIIAWWDSRSGNKDIYAQRVDSSGAPQWTADGAAICAASGWQSVPAITSDGSGGAIIAWADGRSGTESDIYAQRVDSSGTPQWTADGVAICTATGDQYVPAIVSDGSGGAIIAWEDWRSTDADIYAQRVDSAGTPQWTVDGVAICTESGIQGSPAIVSDGSGGAIITWMDERSGTDSDIYAQRVDSSGTPQWAANGVAICTALYNQYYPEIVSDGSSGAVIAWEDRRSGTDGDIFAQRVDSAGTPQWTADGVAVCTASDGQYEPTIVSDGSGGAIITWIDERSGVSDIYAQRVDSSGTPQWTADGAAICAASGWQSVPAITSDGSGGAIITWKDRRSGSYDIYARRVDSSGTPQWAADGVAICTASDDQEYPTIISDGSGGAIIAWQDNRGTDYDIYAQRVNADGLLQEKYLDITGGDLLWCESIAGEDAYTYATVVGDLDGDGKPDVLVWTHVGPSGDRTATVIAKKGSDGSHLWEQSIAGEDAYVWGAAVPDLDGDGKADVLVYTAVGPDSDRTAAVIAKKGSDGTHLWEQSITGEDASVYVTGEGGWEGVVADLDGDGKPDVLVRTRVGPSRARTAAVIAKKGNDGIHLWEESVTGERAYMWAEVVGDLDGDGKEDVLVETEVGPSDNRTKEVIAKKGSDGTHLWEESIIGEWAYMWAEGVGDLDGDGREDVLVTTLLGPWWDATGEVIAKKGSDGTHFWEESITGMGADMWAEGVGDLDGDGKPDVLVITWIGPSHNTTVTVIAKKGSDGSHLWQESVTGEDADMWATAVDDLDGDGKPDVLVRTEVGPYSDRTAQVIAKKGSDGTHLWEESIIGQSPWMWAMAVDDLDGDGKPDVLVGTLVRPLGDWTREVIAKKGTDGTHLWQESVTGENTDMWAEVVGDLDGDGNPDVLVRTKVGPYSDRTAAVIAKKGNDGIHLWQESITGEDAYMWAEDADDIDGDGRTDVIVRTEVGPPDNRTWEAIAKKGSDGTHFWEAESNDWMWLAYENPDGLKIGHDLDGDGRTDVVLGMDEKVCAVSMPTATHTWTFHAAGFFPKHLPDSYTGQVVLAGLNAANIPPEVQGVWWYDGAALDYKFWVPGVGGDLMTLTGQFYNYMVLVTGPCEWEIPLP